jgi:type IV fimbrial biogenesis protein FimT
MKTHPRGFTLIELMIALSLFAILLVLAGPIYADFMGNSQIRNAGENTLAGIRTAQSNAIHNNQATKFVLDTTAAGGWSVFAYDDETSLFAVAAASTYRWTEGAAKTTVTVTPAGATTLTFDGLGRVVANGYPQVPDGTASITRIDVTNSSVSTPRQLAVLVTALGGATATKLCDLAVLAPDPRSCS